MTEFDSAHSSERFDYEGLQVIYGDLYPIEDTFALLADTDTSIIDAHELYSDRLRERIIVIREGSALESIHDNLQTHGIDVLEKTHINDKIVLPVPKNTRSIESMAALIEDAHQEHYDTTQYLSVFRMLGQQLCKLHEAGFGTPSGNWLQQFAFSPVRDSPHGARVFFLPPYHLSDELEPPEEQLAEFAEFLMSGEAPIRTESLARHIVEEVGYGWRER
jgi:hypothetical protein